MKTNIATMLVSVAGMVSIATGHFNYLFVLIPTAIALLITEAFTILRIADDRYSVPTHRMLMRVIPPALLVWASVIVTLVTLLSPCSAHADTLVLQSNAAPVIDPNSYHVPKTLPGFGMHTAAKLSYPTGTMELQSNTCATLVAGGPWFTFFQWKGEAQEIPQGCWQVSGSSIRLVWTLGHEVGMETFSASEYALHFNPKPEYWGAGHDPQNVAAIAALKDARDAARSFDSWYAGRARQLGASDGK